MQETVLGSDGLRECCGRKPIFHRFHFKTTECWAVECSLNGHIHNTGLCDSQKMAVWRWQNQKYRK